MVEALTRCHRPPRHRTAWMIQVTFADRAGNRIAGPAFEPAATAFLIRRSRRLAETSVPGMVFDIQRVDRRNPAGMTSALVQAFPFINAARPGGPPSIDPANGPAMPKC